MAEENSLGYWGPPTANIDWCEANYEVSYFIAEFWNTLSNLSMLILPLFGILYGLKDGLEMRYILSFLAIIVVGTGSWFFHATLLYECQLLDELPMIWGSAIFMYTIKETYSPPNSINLPVVLLLSTFCLAITWIYISVNQAVFFQAAYALMIFLIVYYGWRILTYHRKALYLFTFGLGFYGSGFLCWSLDNIFCGTLRSIRGSVASPLRPFFQGHAWWHLLAGIGTYVSILFRYRWGYLQLFVCELKVKFYNQYCVQSPLPISVSILPFTGISLWRYDRKFPKVGMGGC